MKLNLNRVLQSINVIRKRLGKKPLKSIPKGNRKHVNSCPIAKATGLKVYNYTAYGKNENQRKKLPDGRVVLPIHLSTFIKEFDLGGFKEYRLQTGKKKKPVV